MIRNNLMRVSLYGVAICWAGVLLGCKASHPDDRTAVYQSFDKNHLSSVEVFEDQDSGVIRLNGIVGSPDQKSKAEMLARQAAPGYTIQDDLKVVNAGVVSMAAPDTSQHPAQSRQAAVR